MSELRHHSLSQAETEVVEKVPEGSRQTLLERLRAPGLMHRIAMTAATISAAVAATIAHVTPVDAAPKKSAQHVQHHKEKAPNKPKKLRYQRFPQGNARLVVIEGKEARALEGTPAMAEKLSPLKEKDVQKIQEVCEFHDPWKTGIPLVRITKKNLEETVSRHFKVKDMVRIDPKDLYLVKRGYYQKYQGEYYRTVARVDPELVKMLEKAQKNIQPKRPKRKKGAPKIKPRYVQIHTNEGYRPYGENARTYWRDCEGNAKCTAEKSAHTAGMAVDIDKMPGLQDSCLKAVKERGAGGIGMHGANIVHLDSRRGSMVIWGYGNSAPKKPAQNGKKPAAKRTAKK